jgi:hypothetical protein
MQAPDTAAVKKQQTVVMRAHADESVPGIVSRDGASKGKASSVVVGRVVGDTLTAQQAGFADDDGNLTRSINALSVDRDRSEMYEVGSAQLVGVRMGEVLTRKRIVIYPAKLALMIGIALLVGGAFGALIMVLAANDEGDTGQSPVIIQPTSQNSLNSSPPVAAIQCDPGRSHCVKPPPDLTKGNRLRCGAAACEYQYTRISGARVKDLTRQDKFPNKPDKVIALTSGDFSMKMRGDQLGVMMEGFVMAPVTGGYSFSTRSDNASEVWVATKPDTQTTLIKMVELTSCCKRVWGSRTVVWLKHRTYYIRYLVKENWGSEYGSVGMKVGRLEYFPIPITMFRLVEPPPGLTEGTRLRCGAAACEYQYTRISGGSVKDLTRQDKFPNKPDKVIKLTSGGFSSRMRGDKIGVMMEGFVMAPMSTPMGLVSFSTRSDDQSEVWVAAEPDTQTTLMKMVELTSCCKKVVGSRTVVWLRHRTYYIRYLVAENEGYQYGQVGMKVMEEVKHKSWTTRHYFPIPISMFRNATRGSSIHANSG